MKLLVFLLIFIPFISYSQNRYNLSGTVSDEATEEPLPYASVFFSKKHIGTSTNDEGEFQLLIPSGSSSDTIRVSHIGYEPLILTIESCQNQKSFSLRTLILDEVVVSSKASRFNLTEFMGKTIRKFHHNKNTNTHIAYSHYSERAKKDGHTIMFMESLGYAIYMELVKNVAPYSNYKFICENTRCYVDNPLWTEYGKNLNDYPPYYVQPSCNGILRAYRQLESFGLLALEKINKYRFKLDSTYSLNNQRVYAIDFRGGIDRGTIHVIGGNNQILFLDYKTRGYWSTPFHTRLTAHIYMRFNYIDSVPYIAKSRSVYSKNGLIHENNLIMILQKDTEVAIDDDLYGLINFYDIRPFISYQPEQWDEFKTPENVDLKKYEQKFFEVSGNWFPSNHPESFPPDSHERIKSLIEQFK